MRGVCSVGSSHPPSTLVFEPLHPPLLLLHPFSYPRLSVSRCCGCAVALSVFNKLVLSGVHTTVAHYKLRACPDSRTTGIRVAFSGSSVTMEAAEAGSMEGLGRRTTSLDAPRSVLEQEALIWPGMPHLAGNDHMLRFRLKQAEPADCCSVGLLISRWAHAHGP